MKMTKNEKILLAYDCSGSTSGCGLYHETTQRVVRDLIENNNDFTIVTWDHKWQNVSIKELKKINDMQNGFGGTEVSQVAKAIKHLDFKGKLILITDGQVGTRDIDECDSMLLNEKRFSHVDVYLIKSGDRFFSDPNMSVSCPFTRYCPHVVNYISNEKEESLEISNTDIEILNNLDTINTLQDFDFHKESILKALSARMMGKASIDTKIHDQIVRLRQRIVQDIARNKNVTKTSTTTILHESLKKRESWNECLELYRKFVGEYYQTSFDSFEKDISNLLNITKGGLRNSFSHRLRRADVLDTCPISNINETEPQEEVDDTDYTCPITLDSERDVVLLIKTRPPLVEHLQLTPKVVEDIINCPLNALNYKDICESLMKSLDMSISLSAYIKADQSDYPIKTSPFTRDPIMDVLYLGANESQVAGSNTTISKILTGTHRKKIGNMNLWFAVIYILMEKEERFRDIMPFVENQLKWRLAYTQTFASMCGLTKYPNERVSLELACWMVITSPLLELPNEKDMVRAHVFHLEYLFKLVSLTDLYIPPCELEQLKRYAKLIKTMYMMLAKCKRNKKHLDMLMKALHQRCIRVNFDDVCGIVEKGNYCSEYVEWIPIDGPASSEQKQTVLQQLSLQGDLDELYGIYKMINQSVSAENIDLKINWKPVNRPPIYAISWAKYGLDEHTVEGDIPICPATCRPYYQVSPKQTWIETAERVYKMNQEDLVSANACFIHFVQRYNKYPQTRQEFLTYLHYYYVVNRKKESLPAPIMQFIVEIFKSYDHIIRTISVEEFIKLTMQSLMIQNRIAMEKS